MKSSFRVLSVLLTFGSFVFGQENKIVEVNDHVLMSGGVESTASFISISPSRSLLAIASFEFIRVWDIKLNKPI